MHEIIFHSYIVLSLPGRQCSLHFVPSCWVVCPSGQDLHDSALNLKLYVPMGQGAHSPLLESG